MCRMKTQPKLPHSVNFSSTSAVSIVIRIHRHSIGTDLCKIVTQTMLLGWLWWRMLQSQHSGRLRQDNGLFQAIMSNLVTQCDSASK